MDKAKERIASYEERLRGNDGLRRISFRHKTEIYLDMKNENIVLIQGKNTFSKKKDT